MTKPYLPASIDFMPDCSLGGMVATAMRQLVNAAPTATGLTMIEPDGTARYILRATAERFVHGSGAMERPL